MKFAGVFSGIGGFELGLTRAGMALQWHCESHKKRREFLERKFPGVISYADVKTIPREAPAADLICGGDPCPSRSRARAGRISKHPDLAGYFLALVARSKPRWVVRENVPAPDVGHFTLALVALGYGPVIVELDDRDFTGQSRRRQFVLGCPAEKTPVLRGLLLDASNGFGFSASSQQEEAPIAACLTAHPMRLAAEDSYCYEPDVRHVKGGEGGMLRRGSLRVLAPIERERLQGFPGRWTAELPKRQRVIATGNAVNVGCVEFLGKLIMEADRG